MRRSGGSPEKTYDCDGLSGIEVTRARGLASSPGHTANADGDMYGDPSLSGGPSGSTSHQDCPAAASQSTNRNASFPSLPPGSEVTCSRIPLERGRFMARRA